ncbi:hypothetical protein EX30DRAFT_76098 [Ascodesmis nigricans]|uniref:Uncharacterized protein n=1 Tax=Ascodesmis nigricans TaxID=341454 RepID=A0A4S2MTF1_9PEZI|nr:hypothetical protein EX30DRAFT_76098 [Ascodesmis nigricans]
MPFNLVGWGFNGFGQLSRPPVRQALTTEEKGEKAGNDARDVKKKEREEVYNKEENEGNEEEELDRAYADVPITSPRVLDTAVKELRVLWVGWEGIVCEYSTFGFFIFVMFFTRLSSRLEFSQPSHSPCSYSAEHRDPKSE